MAYLIPSEVFELFNIVVLFVLVVYTLGSAFLATYVKSVYHAVLWLIFCLLGVAMIFLLYAESSLLLVVQIIVYAGGITVLMLFAITLSGRKAMFETPGREKLMDWRLIFAGAFLLLLISVYTIVQVSNAFWTLPDLINKPLEVDLIGSLATSLFTAHGITVITLGLLILGAMLGSVYLVKKEIEDV
ncbi:MAG: NADH-quinone oxidoreductase subunit J family protein [Candidatus Hodarchaeales archaeon]|jgi:NADH:ubiquinone oxidoreductase subunit 6 (subunit J)